jgi:hypothetical protein
MNNAQESAEKTRLGHGYAQAGDQTGDKCWQKGSIEIVEKMAC